MRARKLLQRFDRRGITRLGLLTTALIAIVASSGCEESQACFPLNAECSDAAGFSGFFESNLQCCEGTCTAEANPLPPPQQKLFCR